MNERRARTGRSGPPGSEPQLVLGAAGLLGLPVLLEGRRDGVAAVYGTVRGGTDSNVDGQLAALPDLHRVDLRRPPAVRALLERLRPVVVINCAGIVKSRNERDWDTVAINSALPHLVADILDQWGGRLLQVSTDCVFSGRRGGYGESDRPEPDDLYGRSKLVGEITRPPHLTVRTSFIGFELASRRGLLAWFLDQRGLVTGYSRAIWSGLTADRLAVFLQALAPRREITGLLHIAGEAVDKATLLAELARTFHKSDVTIQRVSQPQIDRSLRCERLPDLGLEVPTLPEMLRGLRAWRDQRVVEGLLPASLSFRHPAGAS